MVGNSPVKYKKAPQAPRRFKSSYMFFSSEKHKQIRKELLEKNEMEKIQTTDIAKMVSAAWKALPRDERDRFDEMAKRDKARYEVEKNMYTGPWKVPATRRPSKDPNAPKRPMSAFLAFSNWKRPEVKQQHPGIGSTEISRILATMWRAAPEEERKPFIEEEEKLREAYKERAAEFRKKRDDKKQAERKLREDNAHRIAEATKNGNVPISMYLGHSSHHAHQNYSSHAAAAHAGHPAHQYNPYQPYNNTVSQRPPTHDGSSGSANGAYAAHHHHTAPLPYASHHAAAVSSSNANATAADGSFLYYGHPYHNGNTPAGASYHHDESAYNPVMHHAGSLPMDPTASSSSSYRAEQQGFYYGNGAHNNNGSNTNNNAHPNGTQMGNNAGGGSGNNDVSAAIAGAAAAGMEPMHKDGYGNSHGYAHGHDYRSGYGAMQNNSQGHDQRHDRDDHRQPGYGGGPSSQHEDPGSAHYQPYYPPIGTSAYGPPAPPPLPGSMSTHQASYDDGSIHTGNNHNENNNISTNSNSSGQRNYFPDHNSMLHIGGKYGNLPAADDPSFIHGNGTNHHGGNSREHSSSSNGVAHVHERTHPHPYHDQQDHRQQLHRSKDHQQDYFASGARYKDDNAAKYEDNGDGNNNNHNPESPTQAHDYRLATNGRQGSILEHHGMDQGRNMGLLPTHPPSPLARSNQVSASTVASAPRSFEPEPIHRHDQTQDGLVASDANGVLLPQYGSEETGSQAPNGHGPTEYDKRSF